jgi:hypothetical protein
MTTIAGQEPKAYLKFLMERAKRRRGEDQKRVGVVSDDPKRPGAQWRIHSTLAYAINRDDGKRYAGYSGTPGGMSHADPETGRGNVFMDTAQAKRRLDRLDGISKGAAKPFDPKKQGVPGFGGASGRPYCRCAEPAALSIALSKGEKVGDLVFCAFTAPEHAKGAMDCLFAPCPNCSMWLNRFSGGYFTRKGDLESLATQGEAALKVKSMNPTTGKNRDRRDSGFFIINPPRTPNNIAFDFAGEIYILRLFPRPG